MLLTRNLLYTAVTRAKKMVVLIGSKKCIGQMVHNNFTKIRYTMLKYFLELDGEKYVDMSQDTAMIEKAIQLDLEENNENNWFNISSEY